MLNFYEIVKTNLNFNRFQYKDTVCLEYTCPIEAEQIGIFSKADYVVHVLSGKKTYKTVNGEWTVTEGQTLFLKKGAEIIHQYFDDQYCMLGFFLSDDLIRETFEEVKSEVKLKWDEDPNNFTGREVESSSYLEGYFHSMLSYFRNEGRPPDSIMVLKLKELLINLMNNDPLITSYFKELCNLDRPSLRQTMEKNFRFNLRLQDYAELCHRSISSFKRDFQNEFKETPGKWLTKRRIQHAANLLANTSESVAAVAYDSGFEYISHFSRVFKSELGVPPTEFKKNPILTS